MFGQERHAVIAATIATDATFSSAIFIGGANKIAIEIPTFAGGISTDSANVYAVVCSTVDGTFRRLKDMGVYSANSGIGDWEVPRTIGNYTVVCNPAVGFKYLKLEIAQGSTSMTATAGLAAKIHVIN